MSDIDPYAVGEKMTEETMKILDKLWAKIDDSKYATHDAGWKVSYNMAIQDVLGLIESLGGKDPIERARENGQFGVGA